MKTNQTFSILIWANKARLTNDGLPIYARVTIDGRRAEIFLKRWVKQEHWDNKTGLAKGNTSEAKSINNHITHVKAELLKIYNQMQVLDENINAELLKLKYTGQKEEKKTILQIVDYHNSQIERLIGIDYTQATYSKYLTLRDKLEKFIKYEYKKSDTFLEDLNYKFVASFEYYLKSQLSNGHNTTMKTIKNLKKIINLAVQNEWIEKNPFTSFKCSYKNVDRQVLTLDELATIENKEFKIERLQQVKDLFIFSCYTGLAYVDVMNLTTKNLVIGIDGQRWIYTNRQKTANPVHIPLLPMALQIIEKYKNSPLVSSKELLLPHLSNQKLNSYLKEIGDSCKLNKNLTFHLARHTFATTITLTNGVPIETVSKLLGHSSIKITQVYAKVVESKISQDMNLLKSKLTPLVKKTANQ